jgi:hypothetical protein
MNNPIEDLPAGTTIHKALVIKGDDENESIQWQIKHPRLEFGVCANTIDLAIEGYKKVLVKYGIA